MRRLPQPGTPNWSAELNDFLLVAHQENGMVRNARPVINARDHGAVGDGAADDTGALQRAIQDAAGGTLFIPAGTYSTRKLVVPSEITIMGEGRASVLQLCTHTYDALMTNQDWENGNQHIVLRDLRLEGNRANNDQKGQNFFPKHSGDQDKSHGVNFHGVAECLLENLEVNDFYYDSVYLGSSIYEHYQDGQPDRSHGSDRNIVRGSRISGSGRNGITITRGTDNHIVDNFLHANNIGAIGGNQQPFYAGAITIEPNDNAHDVSRNEAQQVTLVGNMALNNGASPRAQMLTNGADPIYAANRVGPAGIPAASRVVRDSDLFAANWRLYGNDTELYLQNQRSGKTYQMSIAPMA
jgi:hypothetical protein